MDPVHDAAGRVCIRCHGAFRGVTCRRDEQGIDQRAAQNGLGKIRDNVELKVSCHQRFF